MMLTKLAETANKRLQKLNHDCNMRLGDCNSVLVLAIGAHVMLHCIKESELEWIIGYCDCNPSFVTVQFDRLTNTEG